MQEQLHNAIDTGILLSFHGVINPEDKINEAQIQVEANLNTVSNEFRYYATIKHRMKEIEEFKVDDDDFLRFGEMTIDETACKFEVSYEYERF